MPDIQTRLEPPESENSRGRRKYSFDRVWTAIELASRIGVKQAAKDCGIAYRRLIRLVCAERRIYMTVEEGLQDVYESATLRHPNRNATNAPIMRGIGLKRQSDLAIRIDAAKEGYRMSQRTGVDLSKCLAAAARQRGLNGKSLCELVREGRIPLHWIR